jgi:hypothetical protein
VAEIKLQACREHALSKSAPGLRGLRLFSSKLPYLSPVITNRQVHESDGVGRSDVTAANEGQPGVDTLDLDQFATIPLAPPSRAARPG